MSLTNAYVQNYGQLGEFFSTIQRGQAPAHFTLQHLKDLGFASSNYRAVIPLMKALSFLSTDGQPAQRYHDYRDASESKRVMGQALREAYGDLFVLRAHPTEADRKVIVGKFKSTHNSSDLVAKLMANTFYSLLALADVSDDGAEKETPITEPPAILDGDSARRARKLAPTGLHYNIEIHLPATKDIEVFNAIFKSLREHLIE